MSKTSRPKSKKNSKPQPSKPESEKKSAENKEPTLEERVVKAQQDLEKWQVVALQPGLSPEAQEVARNLARSSRAALQLGQKALLYQAEQGPQEPNTPSLPSPPEMQSLPPKQPL